MNVKKVRVNKNFTILDRLFLINDLFYITTDSFRISGSTINYHKVFLSSRSYIGAITSDKYWEIDKLISKPNSE